MRIRRAVVAFLAAGLVCLSPTSIDARSGSSSVYSSHSSSAHSSSHGGKQAGTGHGHSKATGVPRDSHGKIRRSEKAKEEFKKRREDVDA